MRRAEIYVYISLLDYMPPPRGNLMSKASSDINLHINIPIKLATCDGAGSWRMGRWSAQRRRYTSIRRRTRALYIADYASHLLQNNRARRDRVDCAVTSDVPPKGAFAHLDTVDATRAVGDTRNLIIIISVVIVMADCEALCLYKR